MKEESSSLKSDGKQKSLSPQSAPTLCDCLVNVGVIQTITKYSEALLLKETDFIHTVIIQKQFIYAYF